MSFLKERIQYRYFVEGLQKSEGVQLGKTKEGNGKHSTKPYLRNFGATMRRLGNTQRGFA